MSASPAVPPASGALAADGLDGPGGWLPALQAGLGGWEGGLAGLGGWEGGPAGAGGLGRAANALLAACAPAQTDALQLLAALQQQQQLAQAAAAAADADPLVGVQQGLSARVQEVLLLKQQLQHVVPPRPSGIRGTGPLNNPLYKASAARGAHAHGRR